jgi:small GTP-binding protein
MGCDFSLFSDESERPSFHDVNIPPPVEISQHKVILVGDIAVGKSSLVQSLLQKDFSERHVSTIGTSFVSTMVKPSGENTQEVKLHVWDTAGEERYRSMSRFFFRSTQVGLLIYDVQTPSTLGRLKSWYDDIIKFSPEARFIVVGNKIDCTSTRQVSTEEGQGFADEIGAEYMETSAKTGAGVAEVFQRAADCSLKAIQVDKS